VCFETRTPNTRLNYAIDWTVRNGTNSTCKNITGKSWAIFGTAKRDYWKYCFFFFYVLRASIVTNTRGPVFSIRNDRVPRRRGMIVLFSLVIIYDYDIAYKLRFFLPGRIRVIVECVYVYIYSGDGDRLPSVDSLFGFEWKEQPSTKYSNR